MPKPGPRTTYRYTDQFKATAVRLSQLPGVAVGDIAASLYIHPFMLSRWRKQAREGLIMTKGVAVDKEGEKGSGSLFRKKRGQVHYSAEGTESDTFVVLCYAFFKCLRALKIDP
ncbi:transposase [Rhodanobacter sp. FDAARGOS 1247]|uniref:transposase n=1 Tax=Rhodanobacter sp. FDAARGOS 1247 TaxID=2778082 RepID=UPI00194E43F5|nr:transposase [Rhodanobacter sp. FDAARGOS 1247]QRP63521.1 transposase [Rhodanobacter sp. FDAARGOS 1247]